LGRPSKIQAWNWRFRSSSSVNQNPRVLEAHDACKETKHKNASIIHAVQSISQVLAHNYSSVNGQLEVHQSASNQSYDPLHSIDLLAKEDVHGLKGAHFLKTFSYLI
ncbi:hypothetical protein GOODEAATRI_032306, partial [Goodea atripinnis]